jgi:hypothetical protein
MTLNLKPQQTQYETWFHNEIVGYLTACSQNDTTCLFVGTVTFSKAKLQKSANDHQLANPDIAIFQDDLIYLYDQISTAIGSFPRNPAITRPLLIGGMDYVGSRLSGFRTSGINNLHIHFILAVSSPSKGRMQQLTSDRSFAQSFIDHSHADALLVETYDPTRASVGAVASYSVKAFLKAANDPSVHVDLFALRGHDGTFNPLKLRSRRRYCMR